MFESRPCYLVIRHFVNSNEFETPFALQLLSKILNEVMEEPKILEEMESTLPDNSNFQKRAEVIMETDNQPLNCQSDIDLKPEKETPVLEENNNNISISRNEDVEEISNSINDSCSTELYDSDCIKTFDNKDKTLDKDLIQFEENKNTTKKITDSKLNYETIKRMFFNTDVDTSSETTSEEQENLIDLKKRVAIKKENAKSKEPKIKCSNSEQDKELKKLLRLSEMKSIINNKKQEPGLREKNEKSEIKKKDSKEKTEGSLMDSLEEAEEDIQMSFPCNEEKGDENQFLSLVNDDVKNLFLLSTAEDSSDNNAAAPKKSSKRKKLKKANRKKGMKVIRFSDISTDSTDSCDSSSSSSTGKASRDDPGKQEQKVKTEKLSKESSDSCSEIQMISPTAESTPTKGRKNINKILKKEYLQVETKQALKTETERKKRLNERQKAFDKIFLEGNTENKLILDFDPESKKVLLEVDEVLAKKLKPHQKEGIKFMWNNCFESLKKASEDCGSGCILAHCMGLGKTLQVITLVHTLVTHNSGVRTVLILCPLNTVRNWIHEFDFWLEHCKRKIVPFELSPCKTGEERISRIQTWKLKGGVMVLSYQTFRALIQSKKESSSQVFSKELLEPGPDLIVCDEGHVLKNESSNLSKCLTRVPTLRRIVLTGTPLQNNLIEYYSMVHFVKPNILGTQKEFMNRFVNPINNGQFEDSTQKDVRIMKRRAHVLHTMLEGFVQRFSYSVLKPFLPEKQEYVISVALTESQANVYRFFIDTYSKKSRGLFRDFNWVRKIWTHPLVMLKHSRKLEKSDEGANKSDRPECMKEYWGKHVSDSEFENLQSSGKLLLLFQILKKCKEIGDKILVFSQCLDSLDLIEHFLHKVNMEYEEGTNCEYADTWISGLDYFRMDGSTNSETRDFYCRKFNNAADKRSRLFLISTRAGGLGINLVGANRVIVFDASWNPSHDVQCIFRIYRFGQKKPCYIYRFLASATMEEKIYERQVTKLSLAHRILDEHQIERHYSMGNLQKLYIFNPVPKEEMKVPKLPKDKLFAEILGRNRDIIVSYHEHDSLLENKEEEELTEEERRVAWEEYEKEKLMPTLITVNEIPKYFMESNEINSNNEAIKIGPRYQQGLIPVLPENIEDTHNSVLSNKQNHLCKIVNAGTVNE